MLSQNVRENKTGRLAKYQKEDKEKNLSQNYMKASRSNINFIIIVNWLNWPIK